MSTEAVVSSPGTPDGFFLVWTVIPKRLETPPSTPLVETGTSVVSDTMTLFFFFQSDLGGPAHVFLSLVIIYVCNIQPAFVWLN